MPRERVFPHGRAPFQAITKPVSSNDRARSRASSLALNQLTRGEPEQPLRAALSSWGTGSSRVLPQLPAAASAT